MDNRGFLRFVKNRAAVLGLLNIFIWIFIAIFGYLIVPDNSINANRQNITLRHLAPGFHTILIIEKDKQSTAVEHMFFGNYHYSSIAVDSIDLRGSFYYFKPFNKNYWDKIDKKKISEVKSQTFWMGTDGLGRDVLSRILIGTRVSLLIGIIAVFISLVIGSIMGMLAGYYGGIIDRVISWVISLFWTIPTILFAMLLLMGYRGESKYQILLIFLAVGLTMWTDTARLIRGLIFQLRERQFVEAAKALGYSDVRIILRHIFPNTFSALIVITASNFASAILMESGLSYLGLGVQPPTPSWGAMLREYYQYLGTEASYLAIFPGLAIMIAVFSFYVLGNGLRDAGDVNIRI